MRELKRIELKRLWDNISQLRDDTGPPRYDGDIRPAVMLHNLEAVFKVELRRHMTIANARRVGKSSNKGILDNL